MNLDEAKWLDQLLCAAMEHGEQSGDITYECGDLQQILRACWARMGSLDREVVYNQFKELIDEWPHEASAACSDPS